MFRVVAVPPFAVAVNKILCADVLPVLAIVTPELMPAGPRGTTNDSTGAAGSVTSTVAEHVG